MVAAGAMDLAVMEIVAVATAADGVVAVTILAAVAEETVA